MKVLRRLQSVDSQPAAVRLARALRRRLPGDVDYGDPLSVAGDEPPQLLAQRLALVAGQRPSALRELGFGALQVWQGLSEAQGRGHGDRELAVLFTDLVGFSTLTLEGGDTLALEVLRRVGGAVEPCVTARRGRIVKRLGDGLMAVFEDPVQAVEAAVAARDAVRDLDLAAQRLQLRAGVHLGRPRKLGGDYFGADVNIAARVADAAGADEVLVTEAVRARLEDQEVRLKRRWLFSAKGAPRDLRVYSVG